MYRRTLAGSVRFNVWLATGDRMRIGGGQEPYGRVGHMPVAISARGDCELTAGRGASEGQNRRFGSYAANATPFASDQMLARDVWEVPEVVVVPVGSGSTRLGLIW